MSCLLDASEEETSLTSITHTSTTPRPLFRSRWRWSCYGRLPLLRLQGDGEVAVSLLLVLVIFGSVLGLSLPASKELHGVYRRVSAVIGWTYFCSWSVSFYPQVLLNYRRQTSVGVSFDFLVYNVLAFMCYAAFTCSLFWSDSVQRTYDKRHAGKPNKVQLNDAVFAIHAAFISSVTLAQALYYDWRAGKQRPSWTATAVCCCVIACAAVYAGIVATEQAAGVGEKEGLTWLDFLYFLSYVKVGTGIIKYVPQVVLNARRRSTKGWTIWNVILDLTGGVLSVLQLVLDCWNTGDWSGIRGYPVKFAIGLVSVIFDVIFMFQHYVLYRHSNAARTKEGMLHTTGAASAPLLQDSYFQGSSGGGENIL